MEGIGEEIEETELKTSSAKAKGRRLQQKIRNDLRELGKDYGLTAGDVESRSMGCFGVDVILSPAGLKVFPFDIEAKNQESINLCTTFWKHYRKYEKTKYLKMLVHCKNHSEPTVTIRWKDLLKLYGSWLQRRNLQTTRKV